MSTSDGIATEDWDVVHTLAVEIVNADGDQRTQYRRRLLSLLGDLETKYGQKPSILATRADYLDADDPAREQLLLRAHSTAASDGDTANMVHTAQSSIELFLEWRRLTEADHWLEEFRTYLDRCSSQEANYSDYETLRAEYRKLVLRLANPSEDHGPKSGASTSFAFDKGADHRSATLRAPGTEVSRVPEAASPLNSAHHRCHR